MILKQQSRKITVAEMAPHVHNFLSNENKVDKLCAWLLNWIKLSLEHRKIKPYDFLPSKGDLACHIGVSQGTMQNVFRRLEDAGVIESKQRIGTYIKDVKKVSDVEKLTSKRELAVEIIKKYIQENGYKIGEKLISTRKLAAITGISNTTIRIAMTCLVEQGVLEKADNVFVIKDPDFTINQITNLTLVEKISDNIRIFIQQELKSGDKLPSNSELMRKFNVSLKTIHDAIKLLAKEGIVYTRRGQYGTTVSGEEKDINEQYCYEKIEHKIRHYISSNNQIGDKLPSIKAFAQMYETSEKTVKKALDNLADEGYVTFSRGRYGGTFVTDIPQKSAEAYKWLAINPDFMSN